MVRGGPYYDRGVINNCLWHNDRFSYLSSTTMADDDVDPMFIGFGAFETTAFVTSVLVALYSLISNPTGRQRASDQAEYQVYAGWRNALLSIILQLLLMIAVVLDIIIRQSDVPHNARFWLILLMLTPWAPLAGPVRDTLTSGVRVCQMMRSRLVRNELSAIIRDRFKFGQRGISIPSVLHHMRVGAYATKSSVDTGVQTSSDSVVLAALRECVPLRSHEAKLASEANKAARYDEDDKTVTNNPKLALELGNLWVVNQGPQPSSISQMRLQLWAVASRLDILARIYTGRQIELHADCMRNLGIGEDEVMLRARVLDLVDTLQQGGTMSDDVVERTLAGKFCERCILASRVTVESYLESSERGHTDLRGETWMLNMNMDWRGEFERIMDSMWEAAFMDNGATKLGFDPDDEPSRKYGDRSKAFTTRMMGALFVIARSVVHSDNAEERKQYGAVADVVAKGPVEKEWWDRFWNKVLSLFKESKAFDGDVPDELLEEGVAAKFKGALRSIIDEDMREIVDIMSDVSPIELCSDDSCRLYNAKIKITVVKKAK